MPAGLLEGSRGGPEAVSPWDGDALLSVRGLTVEFVSSQGDAAAIRDISFDIGHGEIVALVGESGSGKTVTSLAIMRLLPVPPARIAGGEIILKQGGQPAENLLALSPREMRRRRGHSVGMIFQEPMTSLNPMLRVGTQIVEAIRLHNRMSKADALNRAEDLLVEIGIPDARLRLDNYPHQLSGGMRQRVMIAIALACRPALLVADEPTTALDVTIQAQILDIIRRLQRQRNMSVLFITHDLGVVSEIADRMLVMYLGQIVEAGTTRQVLDHPRHPYTRGLLNSVPRLDDDRKVPLRPIPGTVPELSARPAGCAFHPRCPWALPGLCDVAEPQIEAISTDQHVRCLRWRDIGAAQ